MMNKELLLDMSMIYNYYKVLNYNKIKMLIYYNKKYEEVKITNLNDIDQI